MPPGQHQQKSILESLRGLLADFLRNSGISCPITLDVACDLVFLLSAYREEEVPLFPEVYLLGPSPVRGRAGRHRPRSRRVPIGTAPLDRRAAARGLENCAGLATGGWAIFLRREPDRFAFGVFRAYQLPFSVSADESLASPGNSEAGVVLLRNCTRTASSCRTAPASTLNCRCRRRRRPPNRWPPRFRASPRPCARTSPPPCGRRCTAT